MSYKILVYQNAVTSVVDQERDQEIVSELSQDQIERILAYARMQPRFQAQQDVAPSFGWEGTLEELP